MVSPRPPPGKNSIVSYKDSWEDCSKCMCKLSEKIFICVGEIHPDGQNFQIFCQFEETKMAISRPL